MRHVAASEVSLPAAPGRAWWVLLGAGLFLLGRHAGRALAACCLALLVGCGSSTDPPATDPTTVVATPTPVPELTPTAVAVPYVLQNSTILGPGMSAPEPLTGTFDVTDTNPHCCNVAVSLDYSNIHWRSASYTITGSGSSNATTFNLQAFTVFTLDPGDVVTFYGQQPVGGHFSGDGVITDLTVTGGGYTITLNAAPTGGANDAQSELALDRAARSVPRPAT